MAPYNKPYLTTDQQIALLRSRGMSITDDNKASACLARIGYYRLSAYWYPNRKSETFTDPDDGLVKKRVLDEFRNNTSFSDALDFYVYDKKLRLLALDALERIEVGIRTDIALTVGLRGAFAHRDPTALHGNFTRQNVPAARLQKIHHLTRQGRSRRDIATALRVNIKTVHFALDRPQVAQQSKFSEWLVKFDAKFDRAKRKEDFAQHFADKYPNDAPPIWVAVEVWDFGTMSHFFAGMKVDDRKEIAGKYGVSGDILESWLRNLNDIRNFCAHHSRLWNRNMDFIPVWPGQAALPKLAHVQTPSLSRFYASAVIIQHLLSVINPASSWGARLIDHVETLPENPYVTLESAGFPQDWCQQDIWCDAQRTA